MAKEKTIEVKGLYKSFGDVEVLKNVSFSVAKGEILALLGPNGAGKTTTIRMLSTLLRPDKGLVRVAGFNVIKDGDKVRAKIGLTGQFAAVDEYLTGRENVELIGGLYHLPRNSIKNRAEDLLRKLDLLDAADRPAKTYSGGMKRRLDLAMSLVASPPVLFLDEPTTGLDPRSRLALWGMIKQLTNEGTTILLTTQYMDEADYLADSVIVIDQGKIIAEGTVNELKAQAGAERVEILLKNKKDLTNVQKIWGPSITVNQENNTITMPAKNGIKDLKKALDELEKAKISVETAALRRPTLDDVFLALTGHGTAEDSDQEASK